MRNLITSRYGTGITWVVSKLKKICSSRNNNKKTKKNWTIFIPKRHKSWEFVAVFIYPSYSSRRSWRFHSSTRSHIFQDLRRDEAPKPLPHLAPCFLKKKESHEKSSPCFVMPCGKIWSSIIIGPANHWMIYDWPSQPGDGFLDEGHNNHPVPLWSQGKTSSKAWGQRMASMPGTKCIKEIWYHMIYTHIIHIMSYIDIIDIHTITITYHNIHIFSMKSIFEQLTMIRKRCTWWDSPWHHTFNWSATYWSSVMSGDKPSNSSQASGECMKRW